MRWEEIATEDKPVTFTEWAIVARYGGSVPKGENWCWDFSTWDLAWECFHRLNPAKFTHVGLRISLKEQPMPSVWTMRLNDANNQGRYNELGFRMFPVREKMSEEPEGSLFRNIVYDENFERLMVHVYTTMRKHLDTGEKSAHCAFLVPPDLLVEGSAPLVCSLSYLEVR